MIIRRKIEHGYTVMPRAAFEDTRLSYEARGMLGYILVKPNDWRVNVADLARQAGDKTDEETGTVTRGCGRDRIYRILAELRAAGYMTHSQPKGPDGRLLEGEYVVTDDPVPQVQEKPDTEKPDTAEPDAGNTGAYKRLSATENEAEANGPPPVSVNPPPKPSRGSTPRRPSPWSAFHDLILADYGAAPTAGNHGLAGSVIATAQTHGLTPEQAVKGWAAWRAALQEEDRQKFYPLHKAANGWGEFILEVKQRGARNRAAARPAPAGAPPDWEELVYADAGEGRRIRRAASLILPALGLYAYADAAEWPSWLREALA